MDDFMKTLKPFECENVPATELRSRWLDYRNDFGYLANTLSKNKKKKLKSIFLTMAGRQLQKIYESLEECDSDNNNQDEDETNAYHDMITRLDEYFAPKQHEAMERYNFWSMKLHDGETLDKFIIRATVAANKCEFGNSQKACKEIVVCDKILMMAPPELRKRILEKPEVNIDTIQKMVNSFLSVQNDVQQLNVSELGKTDPNISTVNKISSRFNVNKQFDEHCGRCGYKKHKKTEVCPAREAICRRCNGSGHYARKCKSTVVEPRTQSYPGYSSRNNAGHNKRSFYKSGMSHDEERPYKRSRVNAIQDEGSDSEDDIDYREHFVHAIGDNQDERMCFKIGGVNLEMTVDSGSRYNIIDGKTYRYLLQNGSILENVNGHPKKILTAYAQQTNLPIMCSFKASLALNVEVNGIVPELKATFYVINEGNQNLLGKVSATKLGILHIGLPSTMPKRCEEIKQISEVFPSIKDVEVFIEMDPYATPIRQQVRRVPLALRKEVEEELNKMLRLGIIEPVTGTSEWVSALVPVVNDSGRSVRICSDMRRVNMGIQRKYHIIPTLDEILSE